MLHAPLLAEHLPGRLDARARGHVPSVEEDAACQYLQRLAALHTSLVQAAADSDLDGLRRSAEIGHNLLWGAADLLQNQDTDFSPRMIENARRLHPHCRFSVASATELDLAEASLGGVLGWWSLFNLPRDVLPQVLAHFAHALKPGGHLIVGTHVGDEDAVRTEAYGGVPVRWTTHKWRPEQLMDLIEQAGLHPVAELRLPADELSGSGVVVMAKRSD
ncbi:class I SAM-dependent methyltransferase [Streptomyces canus]|uniref:class I SAM-dependent methyltransferase n=1 Tax=Streptomyces canus TaxID=58343 RepID=UPI0030DF09B7